MSASMNFTALSVILIALQISVSLAHSSSGTHLSTFRTENLRIRAPSRRFPSIIDEAIWLMKSHFLKRQSFSKSDWANLHTDFVDHSDINEAMENLMKRFDDPYSRHIPETHMRRRQRGIRGEAVGIGIVLKRKWHVNELGNALRELFLSPRSNYTALDKVTEATSKPMEELSTQNTPFSMNGIFRRKYSYFSNSFNWRGYFQYCAVLLQHYAATFQTAAPFLLGTTCKYLPDFKLLGQKLSLDMDVIRLVSFGFGLLHILKKVTPIICPIEVAFLQPGGPSFLSGVAVGDQIKCIDGKEINSLSLKKVNDLLSDGEVGDTVNISIIRTQRNSDVIASTGENHGTFGALSGSADTNLNLLSSGGTSRTLDGRNPRNPVAEERRVSLSLDVVRDDVFASRVSSTIVYHPKSSSTRSSEQFRSKDFLEKESLVASAGVLHSDVSDSDVGNIGYIAIAEFTQRTLFEVEDALESIKSELFSGASDRQHLSDGSRTRSSSSVRTGSGSKSESSEGDRCHLDALIIDLRGNLGGTLPSALDAASLFLPRGKVLLQMKGIASSKDTTNDALDTSTNALDTTSADQVDSNGRTEHLGANNAGQLTTHPNRRHRSMMPFRSFKRFLSRKERTQSYYSTYRDADTTTSLLLLVDSQTASASEIFAAALIDNNRATCMGSKTVGKNVAQAIMMLSDGSGLVFTVREFLSPLGRYMGNGIIPHIQISEPSKLDIKKINYNSRSKKWDLRKFTFANNCFHFFQ